jgi:hypothetical protein
MPTLHIFATDRKGYREEITCLYWFEESRVHDWEDSSYTFELVIDDTLVWDSRTGESLRCGE